MITPTVGRVVWYRPGRSDPNDQPLAAIVTCVHSGTCVNLVVFDENGHSTGETSVRLLQDGDERPQDVSFAEWMPYQKGQAAKYEALEAQQFKAPETAKRQG